MERKTQILDVPNLKGKRKRDEEEDTQLERRNRNRWQNTLWDADEVGKSSEKERAPTNDNDSFIVLATVFWKIHPRLR